MGTQPGHTIRPPALTRSEDGRLIGGVAAGIARRFDIEVMVVRVAFVAATLVGGVGAVLYGLALLLLPRDEEDRAIIRVPKRAGLGAAAALGVIALVGAALIDFVDLLGVGQIGVAAYLIALGLAALWWREHMADARVIVAPARAVAHPSPYPTGGRTEAAHDATPKGRSLTLPTISAGLIVVGLLALLNATDATAIGPGGILAAALGVVGVGLVVAAFFARAGGLIPLGILLTLLVTTLATAGTSFSGGFGERTWAPSTAAAIETPYELGAGEATLDLRDTALPPGRTPLRVDIGAGDLTVLLPADTNLDVDVRVGVGNIDAIGFAVAGAASDLQNDSGPNATFDQRIRVPGATSTLAVEVDLGFGNVEVRAPGRGPNAAPAPPDSPQPPAPLVVP